MSESQYYDPSEIPTTHGHKKCNTNHSNSTKAVADGDNSMQHKTIVLGDQRSRLQHTTKETRIICLESYLIVYRISPISHCHRSAQIFILADSLLCRAARVYVSKR